MNKLMVINSFKNLGVIFKKHSPEILTCLGIAGVITSTIFTAKGTVKAVKLIEEKKKEEQVEELTPIETLKVVWPCYVPTLIFTALSVSCIVGANSVNLRRNAALAAAYSLSESSLKEYKDKVIETVGEKKEREIKDAINKDILEKNPVSSNNVIDTGNGQSLCYDYLSGRYFKSDVNSLKKALNEFNRRLLLDTYLSLNDFYEEIGLDSIGAGYDLGWRSENRLDLVEFDLGSQIASDGTPCIVLNFLNGPRPWYNRWN